MRAAALAALVFVAGCGGGAMAPVKADKPAAAPRDIPPIPRSFALQQTTRRRVDGLRLAIRDLGVETVRGTEVSSMKSWSAKFKASRPYFVIRHPIHGAIVFDAGHGVDAKAQGAKTLIVSRISSVQQLTALPGLEVIVEQREWLAARRKAAEDPKKWAGLEAVTPRLVDLTVEPSYGSFDHALDLFKDGTIQLVDLSGASPGTLGVWASLDEGPVLLTGAASSVLDNHQDLALPSKSQIADLDKYWRRLYQMKYMQDALPRLVIYPSRDLAPLRIQPRPDVTLAP